MGSPAAPSPYQQVTSTTRLAPKYEALLGFNKDSSEYSPFQALSRQAGAQAKMIEGMTTRPSWSSMYEAFGVPQGQDLTPYIQAMRQGTSMPMAPIPRSPEAGTIPEYTNPSDTGKEPKKEAAQGGLMSLAKPRGYAEAGKVKALTSQQQQYVKNISQAIQDGKVTQKQIDRLNTIEKNSGLNVSPYSDTGTGTPKNPTIANLVNKTADTYKKQQADIATGAGIPLSQALNQEVPFYDPTGQAYNTALALQQKKASGQTLTPAEEKTLANAGAMLDPYGGVTNPVYRQALDQLRATSQAPETIGEGAGIMSSAAGRLLDQAGYTPQQVAAQNVEAANIARGDIRDVNAQRAEVERMQAAMMQAPTEANVRDYEAAQAQLNQMQGPKSWTDQGTAAQYMSPYMQNVVDIQKREANRDFAKQMARLDAQAAGQGAFGGSRNALERSEARRAQAQRLGDIEAQGLQQAYQSGMGQFSAEQGLGLQAGQANLSAAQQTAMANQQALNQQRQQYVNNALQAAMQSYGGQLTAAQQNQVAQNAASQFNAQSQNTAYNNYVAQQLQAQMSNQSMDYNTAMQNAQLAQQAGLANQQANLQAGIQNQQAGLTGQGLNLQALNQAGQMGQGLGGLGVSTWGAQQNIPQLWGAAGQTVQNIAQQAANAKQQTGMNWWGGMGNAYQGPTNLIMGAAGQQGTKTTSQIPS